MSSKIQVFLDNCKPIFKYFDQLIEFLVKTAIESNIELNRLLKEEKEALLSAQTEISCLRSQLIALNSKNMNRECV